MSLVFTSSSVFPSSCYNQCKAFSPKPNRNSRLTQFFPIVGGITEDFNPILPKKASISFRGSPVDCIEPTNHQSLEFEYEEEKEDNVDAESQFEDDDLQWEGAIIYKRSSATHFEYCTTLERLGLGKVSSEVSRSTASKMGIRVTKGVKDYPFGTAVQVSLDVTKKKKRLRLDGIIRTVIALDCHRCGAPAPESIFSNFTLLLTDEPVEEPDVIDMGMIFQEDKNKARPGIGEEGDEASIDLEDRLYFPSAQKEIDISKNIRDLIHLEINNIAVCAANCKGFCFNCGVNLNTDICKCSEQEVEAATSGPLGYLKQKLQTK